MKSVEPATSTFAPFQLAKPFGIDPKAIDTETPLGSLMLVLALIFNDLKGLLLAVQELGLGPRSRATNPPVASQGQVAGLALQFARLIAALIFELMDVLGKAKGTVESGEMAALVARLPEKERRSWDSLVAAAFEKQPKGAPDTTWKMLVKLRNQVAFHYDRETIGRGYRQHFFASPGKPYTERAVFSDGKRMESSRFYFADAAAEEGLSRVTNLPVPKATERIGSLAAEVNLALKPLVIEYLKAVAKGKAAPYEPERAGR
jgi:hypothetical protein